MTPQKLCFSKILLFFGQEQCAEEAAKAEKSVEEEAEEEGTVRLLGVSKTKKPS